MDQLNGNIGIDQFQLNNNNNNNNNKRAPLRFPIAVQSDYDDDVFDGRAIIEASIRDEWLNSHHVPSSAAAANAKQPKRALQVNDDDRRQPLALNTFLMHNESSSSKTIPPPTKKSSPDVGVIEDGDVLIQKYNKLNLVNICKKLIQFRLSLVIQI